MIAYFKKLLLFINLSLLFCLGSCQQGFRDDCFTAYFGGEVINPTNPYVVFMKDDKVIDTLKLDSKNRFFKKFDSLTPGLYTFKHDPEYQYVYFDKNDSLMVRINSNDFDESIVFCGRGDEKNNFLMELYLKNEADKKKVFELLDYNVHDFQRSIDSSYLEKKAFYTTKKQEINWSEGFDIFANASLNFNYYSKKELYPKAHEMRTGNDVRDSLATDYYDYRKNIDFNDARLNYYSPFFRYITLYLNNVVTNPKDNSPEAVLETGIKKLTIADSLFKNEKIKNTILNNIAFSYFLEDQNISNNKTFLDRYLALSTDNSKKNEVKKLGDAIQKLFPGSQLPAVNLIDKEGNRVSSNDLLKNKSIIFFWTENMESHIIIAHKKAAEYKRKHPDYDIIAINIDCDNKEWYKGIPQLKNTDIKEFTIQSFDDLKYKWAVYKLHRTILLNKEGKIDNAFVDLLDAKFANHLR